MWINPGYPVKNDAAAASLVAKASAGTLLSFTAINTGAAQYIQIYDSATLPANAVTNAIYRVPVADGTTTPQVVSITITAGISFLNGIVACNSSTLGAKTIGGADCYFTAVVR